MPQTLVLIYVGTLLRRLGRLVPLTQHLLVPTLLAFGHVRILCLGFRGSYILHKILGFNLKVQILRKRDHSCYHSVALLDTVTECRVSNLLHFLQVSI